MDNQDKFNALENKPEETNTSKLPAQESELSGKYADEVDLDFGPAPTPDAGKITDKQPKKKHAMNLSRKIAYSATCAAIGIIALVIAFFVPLTTPYIVAGVALYICVSKCGFKFGALTYVAVAGAGLLINIISALPFVFLFGLQPFVSFAMVKLKDKLKKNWIYWFIRIIVVVIFFNAAFFGIYSLASNTMFDIGALKDILGGYLLLAVLGTVIFILYDIATMIITSYMVKVLNF